MPIDLKHAVRALLRAPALTAALVLSLGLGTGANAAVFNLISALMLRPPPGLESPGELVTLKRNDAGSGAGLSSYPEFVALESTGALPALTAYDDGTVTGAAVAGSTYRVRVAKVSAGYFGILGIESWIGGFTRDGDADAAVISHALWQNAGADPEIAGKPIAIDGRTFTIAGVLPPRFQGLHAGRTTGVWIPLENIPGRISSERTLSLVGRARDIDAAEAAAPGFDIDRYTFLEPSMQAQTSLLTAVLMGATLLVLLCACVNAASLLLSRGNARRKDFAVKLALGARRGQLAAQLLLESGLTGLAGAIVALLFAMWTASIVPSLFAPEHAEMLDTRITPAIIAATLVGTTLLGIALGALPALYATAPASLLDLRGDAGSISETGPGTRIQLRLVIVQIALSTVLLVGALLLNKSLRNALEGDLGGGARNVAVATLSEPARMFNPVRGMPSYRIAVEQARKIPGVTGAGLVATLPLGRTARSIFGIETAPGITERIEIDTNVVSLTYFDAMQMPVFIGRPFAATDTALATQVAIVNDIAMQRYFGGAAVGRTLIDARGDQIEVIGVVPSGRYRTLQEMPEAMVYRPLAQVYLPRMHVVVRTSEPPGEEIIEALTPAMNVVYLQLQRIATLDTHLSESLVLDRFAGILVTACGAMALVLAIAGAYSLMLDSVQRRTREIGLRIALGASAARIARSVFGFGFTLTGIGLGAGFVLTVIAERAAKYYVFGLPGIDLAMLAITATILLVVVAFAAILPARRALRVSPTVALRHS